MFPKRILLPFFLLLFVCASCQSGKDANEERGTSTPIDSTNDQGTAPAVYGADNPANDQDTTYRNSTDTGTHVNNGPDNTKNLNNSNNQNR